MGKNSCQIEEREKGEGKVRPPEEVIFGLHW